MRILVMHSRYASGAASGENRVVDDEVSLLRSAGHDVFEYLPEVRSGSSLQAARLAGRTLWSTEAVSLVQKLLTRHRPEIVHVHNLFPMLSPAVIRMASQEAPVVMTLHNYRLLCLPGTLFREGQVCELCVGRIPWRGVAYACYRGSRPASAALGVSVTLHRALGSFQRVSLYLAVSRFLRQEYVKAGYAAEKILTRSHFSWPQNRRVGPGTYFLYLGRLAEEKGIADLVQSWRPEFGPLVVAGEGPFRDSLRTSAAPAVDFRGSVSESEVPPLLSGARAVLVPSLGLESFGRVVIEAYAAGVPVVASRRGALPEMVVDQYSGFLIDPFDSKAWAEAIKRLMEDGESERLGDGAYRRWHDRFTPEIGLASLESAYRGAIERWDAGRTP
jgi:glycosyltransferase involved in cell wall biosynthesis